MRALVCAALLAGCASFEDPTIVLDLRVLAIETTPPEQVLDIDPRRQPTLDEVLSQLQPVLIRALVADPARGDALVWSATACILEEDSDRCIAGKPAFEIASGVLDDPESELPGSGCTGRPEEPGTICALLVPDTRLVQILFAALQDDPTRGLGGIDLGIQLRVLGDVEVFAAKRIRFSPRVPANRRANRNPEIQVLQIGTSNTGMAGTRSHCGSIHGGTPNRVRSRELVTLFPEAGEGDQEEYVLPTLDGGSETFREYLTYRWLANAGSFTEEVTGGPPDTFGNVTLPGTQWRAPEVDRSVDVTVWVFQRDGRYGVHWREVCIRVDP